MKDNEGRGGDPVNNPSHYAPIGGVECIDVMMQQFGRKAVEDFCKLNAFKYLWRMEHKENARQDAAKAQWYLTRYIELSMDDNSDNVAKDSGYVWTQEPPLSDQD